MSLTHIQVDDQAVEPGKRVGGHGTKTAAAAEASASDIAATAGPRFGGCGTSVPRLYARGMHYDPISRKQRADMETTGMVYSRSGRAPKALR
jgi:hypothetical protein